VRCPSCNMESMQPELDLDEGKIRCCMLCGHREDLYGRSLDGVRPREFERIYGMKLKQQPYGH